MNTFGMVYQSTAGNGIAARLTGKGSGSSGIVKRNAAIRSRAVLGPRSLQLFVEDAPVDVRVLGIDGRAIAREHHAANAIVPLSRLIAKQGMYILEVGSGSRMLLTRTVSQVQ
jgi:hypothetical protein